MNKAVSRVGILDSGLGGLTVWSALRHAAPELPCLYLADQAHLPYGLRSDADIRELTAALTQRLLDEGASLIVLACNTASAAALAHLRAVFPNTPFVGMEPAVKPAALTTRSGVVGLMATRGTLRGELLRNTAARFAGHVEIVSSECPGLAEAIENNLNPADLSLQLRLHVNEMQSRGVDTVVLGCTHYPLARRELAEIFGPGVQLIDPAPAIARQIARLWTGTPSVGSTLGMAAPTRPADRFASTAQPAHLQRMLALHFQHDAEVEHWPDSNPSA
jgi:glutamate racemase